MYIVFACCAHGADIVVDFSQTQGPFKNIAGGVNFWGQDHTQKRFIEEVGTDLYRLKIRLHRVQKNADGYANFPWQGDDLMPEEMETVVRNMRRARKQGCRVMIQIYGIPAWLSASKDMAVATNNLPNYAKYPPKDYNAWTDLVSETIRQLGKLGLDDIDYYEVFGEPNAGSTWYEQSMPCKEAGKALVYGCKPNELGHNTAQVMQEFFKVYQSTVMGIKRAAADAEIGGMAVIPNPSGIWWTRFFAEFVKSNELPLAFYSWHWYGLDEALSHILDRIKPKELTVGLVRRFFENKLREQGFRDLEINSMIVDLHTYLYEIKALNLKAIRNPYSFVSSCLERILKESGLDTTKLFLTEWNVSHNFDGRHDTHYGASYIIKGLIDIADSKTESQNFFVLSNRKAFYSEEGFGGFYGLFKSDRTGSPKASYNAFRLFSMMGDDIKRLKVQVSDNDIYAIATQGEDCASLLLTYYKMAEQPDYDLVADVRLRLTNLPFSDYAYKVYLIDKNHSNGFYGSGPELEIVEQGKGRETLNKVFELPVYGVWMLQLKKTHPTM